MPFDVHTAFDAEPSSPYVAYLQDSRKPLNILLFLLPVLAFYHFGLWFLHAADLPVANGADLMLAKLLNFIYIGGLALLRMLTPDDDDGNSAAVWFLHTFSSVFALLLVIFTLLLWQHLSGTRWRFKPGIFVFMLLESALFALPLFALEWFIKYIATLPALPLLAGTSGESGGWWAELVLSLGAGVYEEFLFRLLLMGMLFRLGQTRGSRKTQKIYYWAMAIQALAFAGFHYLPWSPETFTLPVFTFRVLAGLYFGYLYQERSLGIAAGSHAVYDILAVSL